MTTSAQPLTDVTAVLLRKRIAQVGCILALQAAVLFLSAGRLDWPGAWAFLAVYLAVVLVNLVVLLPRHRALFAERARVADNVKTWDRWLAPAVSLLMPLVTLAVSGLDRRYGASADLSPDIQVAALAATVLGYVVVDWAMLSNDFFSGLVRIQTDRGHQVACGGPYRIVRHPGYVGMIVFNLAAPLVLGSLWGMVPAMVTAALFVVRTALEDRTLEHELPGYRAYTERTGYRLVPGLW
jgi:protein-S-isoprenylcysteine O-methyltransferase Ste14